MKSISPVVPQPNFIAMSIQMAQSTFSDVMPSFKYSSTPAVASRPTAPKPTGKSVWTAISDWFYRQQVAEREAYLAKATDVFDLERRLRDYDHQPNFF